MEIAPSKYSTYAEDEIDIRGIVTTLLRYKWIILIVTLGMAIAGFAFSKLVLPKQFQATAMVFIAKPIFTTELDARIQTSPQVPDSRSITDLASSNEVFLQILQSPEAPNLFDEPETPETLRERLEVSLVGTNQLRLSITDTDPQRAAEIANLWAQSVTERLNNLFDVDESSLTNLVQQRESAYQKWIEAEQNLVAYLPENRALTLEVDLAQARKRYEYYLDEIREIEFLTRDAKFFDSRLSGQDTRAPLKLDDYLGLIALQQRSVTGESALGIQAGGLGFLDENYTVADAREALKGVADSLDSKREEIESLLEGTIAQIARLATELEQARYELSELTVKRDLALNAYQALSSQEEETRIGLAQNDQLAKFVSQALPPEEAAGPHSVLNAAGAGILGLMVSIITIFSVEWWKSSRASIQPLAVEQGKSA